MKQQTHGDLVNIIIDHLTSSTDSWAFTVEYHNGFPQRDSCIIPTLLPASHITHSPGFPGWRCYQWGEEERQRLISILTR